MKRLVLALTLVAVGAVAVAANPPEFLETFSYPDGSLPPNWVWTGDPQGGGQFAIQDSQFVHIDGGYAYYIRLVPQEWYCGQGFYDFDVKGSNWEFAWGIYGFPDHGWCNRLYHNDVWGQPGYTLTYSEWSTLSGYPEGQWMFHNSTDLFVSHYWTGPLEGWHHITVQDVLGHVIITVDDLEIIFSGWSYGSGIYIGLGATAGSGDMEPAFDNLAYDPYYSPVLETSWGRIKSLFR